MENNTGSGSGGGTDRDSVSRPQNSRSQAMTQSQIADYLMKRMFRYSENSKILGTPGQDKIQPYLVFIRETTAKTLEKGQMDILEIDDFVDLVEPIAAEISGSEVHSEEERDGFLNEIQQQAEAYVSRRQMDPVVNRESATETEKSPEKPASDSEDPDTFLTQEIIPIGFENGAPRIPVRAFFEFPFGKTGNQDTEQFAQHLRYLEEAESCGVFGADELSKIRSLISKLPVLTYRKNYDIYPLNRFDETILLVVFSLWQNKVLKNLLVTEEIDAPGE